MTMSLNEALPIIEVPAEAAEVGGSYTSKRITSNAFNNPQEDYIPEVGSQLSSEELGNVILRIEVGKGKEPGGTITFRIHHRLLCIKVPMFEKVAAESFEEAADPLDGWPDIVLADDDPKAFKLFTGWLYMGKIEGNFDKFSNLADNSSSKGSFQGLLKSIKLPIYIKLCILAEKYEVTRLEIEAIDFLIKFMVDTKARANPSCWLEVYKQTSPASALRILFSRIAVWQLSEDGGSDGAGTMDLESVFCRNEELRLDISTLTKRYMGRSMADPLLAPACDYHNHGPVDVCPYTTG